MTTPAASAPRFVRDRMTWVLYGMLSLYSLALNALGPMLPYLRQDLQLSNTTASLHGSSFAAGMILAGLGGARLVQRLGSPLALSVGCVGLSLGALGLAFANQLWLSLGACLLMGALGSLVLLLVPTLLVERHPRDHTRSLTEANVGGSLAAVAAPLLIGTLVQTGLGWRSVWLLAALSALILAGLGPHGPSTPAATPEAQGSRSAKLAFWLFWAALLCAVVLEFGTLFWAADLLRTRLQLPQAQATITASLFVVMMVVGRTSASYLLRWASARALIVASALLTSLGLTLYILVPQPALVLPGFALLGLGVANLYPLMLSQLMRSAPGTTAQAGAFACLASGLAILGGPLLLGWISDRLSLLVAHTTLFVALAGLILAQSIGFRLRRMP